MTRRPLVHSAVCVWTAGRQQNVNAHFCGPPDC